MLFKAEVSSCSASKHSNTCLVACVVDILMQLEPYGKYAAMYAKRTKLRDGNCYSSECAVQKAATRVAKHQGSL